MIGARRPHEPRAITTVVAQVVCLSVLALMCGCRAYDPGGDLRGRVAQALDAQRRGAAIEIRGVCYSACALKLASGNSLCIAPDAVIGVHEVRAAHRWDYAGGMRDDLLTGFFEGMLPYCVDSLLVSRHAFDSGRIVTVSGQEVLNACPQIGACAG
jgi:hypothetical protein